MDQSVLLWIGIPTLFAYIGSKWLRNEKLVVDGLLNQATRTRINGKIMNVLNLKIDSALPTILFIHGLGGSIHQFLYQIKHFRRFANIIAVDNVGNGKSDQPSG
jgi:pimeloyl-ACP methyl ester carboxylesterase